MRRSTYLWLAHGMTLAAYVVPALAWSALMPRAAALGVAVVMWLTTALRFRALGPDRQRPRAVTRLLDEPLFWLWGAGLFGLIFSALVAPFVWVQGGELARALTWAWLAGLALAAWTVWGRRRWVRVRELVVEVSGLPAELDGYRIVQLSDLHVGSFDPLERGLAWARLANQQAADLVVVTGDLVTSGTSFYRDAAEIIGTLRGVDGVFVSMGNHDQWDNPQLTRAITERGGRVLVNQWQAVTRGSASLVVAGIDDRYAGRADLDATLTGVPEGAPLILLSHYPDFFEEAAERGVDLVLSGHTHGGQLGLPGLADRVNVATLSGQRGRGLVRRGNSTLYVNAGLGTTGPPMRLGVAPEIAVLVLRAKEHSAAGAATMGAS